VAEAGSAQRLFVAVPVPPETRDAVRALLEPVRLERFGRSVRWVHLDTLHLTLRFLGDTEPDRVSDAREALREAVAGRASFTVRLAGAGSFPPGARKIRAVWLGIALGADQLGRIADALGGSLAARGWDAEPRPYRPHVTVGRTDAAAIRDAALASQALEAAAEAWSTSFVAERVVLYRSHLGSGPVRHEAIDEVSLVAEG
jgi:2'-5' RNA ligase